MDLKVSIEELARTTDDSAVRRRFDRRNLFWSILLLMFFLVMSIVFIGHSGSSFSPIDAVIGVVNFTLVALSLLVMRDAWRIDRGLRPGNWRAARWVREHVSAVVLTGLAVEYALVLAYNRNGEWIPWVMLFPWLLVAIRMGVAELVLIHVFLAAGSMAMTLFGYAKPRNVGEAVIGSLILNAVVLAINLTASRRLRKQVKGDWNERRDQAREQLRMREELLYARELQLSMLPECAPPLDWADLCAISIPATEVGGDYYDYFVDGDCVALVCGDVAGHGMAAGLVLASLRSGFTLLRDSLRDPAAVLRRLHDLVAQTSRRRMLVTVTVVLLNRRNSTATIASAGHPPVLLRRADGTVETIELFAPPLGVRLPVDIPQRRLDVGPGDAFVLHSDGIYETRNARDEVYGIDRLIAVVKEHGDGMADALRDAIIADVERFREGVLQDDDVTVVVAKLGSLQRSS